MLRDIKKHIAFVSVLLFYLVMFLPFLGNVHLFDWDEINFAEAAREMLVTGDWLNVQINYEPFWEKPPLFIWLQALSMKLMGVSEYAARFPNVIVGLITLIVIYTTMVKRYGKQAAIFSLLLYMGSYTPHFYFKSGIIDPLFNLLIFLSILHLIKTIDQRTKWSFLHSGIFLGLAILTKGPAALLLVGVSGLAYQLIYKVHFYSVRNLMMLVVGLLIFPGLYFGIQVMENGTWFIQEFLIYQVELFSQPVASHGQPFYYHFVVLLIGCFPLFIIASRSTVTKLYVAGDVTYLRWMKVLFWVVLIIFSLVTTKIVHYSSLCYIPLAVIGGVWLSEYEVLRLPTRIAIALVGLFWSIILFAAALLHFYPSESLSYARDIVHDDFVLAQLETDTAWSIVPLFLGGLLIAIVARVVVSPSKTNIAKLIVTNTLIVTLIMVSLIPHVENSTQGKWIGQLQSYQGKEVVHFTLGFKSYAHLYYTKQQNIEAVNETKKLILADRKLASIYDIPQEDKTAFNNDIRDHIILHTDIPVSVSAKTQKFEAMKEKYPKLVKVFEGNGYGVWERAKSEY